MKNKNIWLLSTDKPSKLYFNHNKGFEKYQFSKEPFINGLTNTTNQNIYITDDSEIKEGDWCYHPLLKGGSIIQSKFDNPNSTMKKIILTSDEDLIKDGVQAIDDEFLEWFVKNPSCEWVEVEKGYLGMGGFCKSDEIISKDKIHYKIVIPNLEIWKDIPNYEGLYQVSDYGNVKSLSRTITKGNITYVTKDKILKQSVDSVGYPYVNLSDYKKQKTFRIHQLVAVAFLNHTPDKHKGLVIDHIDGNKLNNMATNLQLITNKKNTSKDRKNKTSKYTGVSWHKQSNKWLAQFRENGSVKYLGTFETEEEARDTYNASQNKNLYNELVDLLERLRPIYKEDSDLHQKYEKQRLNLIEQFKKK